MKKVVKLKDGTNTVIRPLTEGDLDKSFEFFQTLSEDDRMYLRVDVSDRDIVEKRLRNVGMMNIKRLIAEIDGDIAADATLEFHQSGWKRHLAEFRLIVSGRFQRKGLGMIMAGELYELAVKEGAEEMIIELMEPQVEAKKIFERLGFKEGGFLERFVKDANGQKQNLVIMRCNLNDIWDQIESYYEEFEIQTSHEHEYA